MSVYLLIAFIVATVFAAACGLMVLDRYFEKKRDERISRIICEGVIPDIEDSLEAYTEFLFERTKKMSEDLVKSFTNDD